jgi:hypothetical protein
MLGIAKNGIAVANARMREINFGRVIRTRARGNDDVLGRHLLRFAVRRLYLHRVRVDEMRFARVDGHAIALIKASSTRGLRFDHLTGRGEQLWIRQLRGRSKLPQ